jgi:hypothetical protein
MTKARDVATQGGLVLLSTTTITNAANTSFNNVFTSAYRNYKVSLDVTTNSTSTNRSIQLRYRANGTDDTSSLYDYGIIARDAGNETVGTGGDSQSSSVIMKNVYYNSSS